MCKSILQLEKLLSVQQKLVGLAKTRKFIEASYIDFPVFTIDDKTIRINVSGVVPNISLLYESFNKYGIKKGETERITYNFIKNIDVNNYTYDAVIKKRIIEFLKEGRRYDARNAIEYYYLIGRRETNEMITNYIHDLLSLSLSSSKKHPGD